MTFRTASGCGRTDGSALFRRMKIISKDDMHRMTKNNARVNTSRILLGHTSYIYVVAQNH